MTKRILFKAFALLAVGAMLFSCKKPVEPTLSVSDKAVNFAADANLEKVVTVTSNQAWTVTCDADWLTIEPKSGEGDGTFKITAKANEVFTERSADIKIAAATLSETIKVTQLANNPTLSLVPTEMTFESEGGSQSFTITSNADWTVSVPDNDWLSVSPVSGNGAGTVTVTAAEHLATSARNLEITVTAEGLTQKVAVSQEGAAPMISVNHDSIVFTKDGGEFTVEVTSNLPWRLAWYTKASSTWLNDWLAVSDISGNPGTTQVSFYAHDNYYLKERIEKVDFIIVNDAGDTDVMAPVTITEDPAEPSRFTDSLALVAIYNWSNGDAWTKDKWDLNAPMNEWKGVTLTDGRVTALKMTGKNFPYEWTMPEDIGYLQELTDLRFNGAQVTGDFMEDLYKLTKLVSLYFQTNNILGSFSEKVTCWPDLKDLYINDNPKFGGTLPKELGQLKKLANINIAKTAIGGAVPAELSGCSALTNFMVYGTQLSSLPNNFDQWPSLKLIQVYDIPTLIGALPSSCGNCAKLTSLWMYNCNFEGNIPELWANLPATCKQVRVQNNKLSGQVPAAFKAHANWTTWKASQYILPQQDGYGLTE